MYPLKIKERYNPKDLLSTAHRFSVVYLWTYTTWDFTEWAGSHPAVDIIPETKNQEIFAPLDGVIHKVWEDGAYGKYIIIEHANVPHPDDMKKTTTLYSGFQHLSNIKVKEWQTVKEWDSIGNTGNTGNSFWEHLHFQIDRQEAPFHSYWPFTGTEARDAGTTFSWWVTLWLGKQKAQMYTVNPLVYLDRVDAYRSGVNTLAKENTPEIQEKIAIIKEETPIAKTTEIPLETLLTSNDRDNLVTPNSFTQEDKNAKTTQTQKESEVTQEKKLDILTSDDNVIIKNTGLDSFISWMNNENQKKNLKI